MEPRKQRTHRRSTAPVVGLVHVYRKAANGREVLIGACLLNDVSRGGVGIRMDNPLRKGDILVLASRHVRYIAKVRHCRPDEEIGFRIGLQFCK